MGLGKIIRNYWIVLAVAALGLLFVFYVPPFQKPDEVVHFLSAASMASGRHAIIESRYKALPDKLNALKIAHKYELKFDNKDLWYKDENRNVEYYEFAPSKTSYLSYLPSITAIKLFGYLDYPSVVFLWARVLGLIVFLISMVISINLIPVNYRPLIWAYSLMPMVLHQATEVSYDVMLLSASLILFSWTLKLVDKPNHKFEIIGVGITALITILIKPGYYALLLCPVMVLWSYLKTFLLKHSWILATIGVIAVILGNVGVWVLLHKVNDKGYDFISPSYQIETLKANPWHGLEVLSKTWEEKRDFYFESFWGYFGWLDYKFDSFEYLAVISIFLYFFALTLRSVKESKLDWVGILILGVIILSTYLLIEIIFWLYWTNAGANVVEGVQGRYFLPLVPFGLWMIIGVYKKIGINKIKIIAPGLMVFWLFLNLQRSIAKRYYDFSQIYSNKAELSNSIEDSKKEELPLEKINSKEVMERSFSTSSNDVIGGFQFALENIGKVRIPYEYKIISEDGDKIYSRGYLDLEKLNKGSIYEQNIEPFTTGGKTIILKIRPIVIDPKEKYFDYVKLYYDVQAKLLFVTKEQKLQ